MKPAIIYVDRKVTWTAIYASKAVGVCRFPGQTPEAKGIYSRKAIPKQQSP